MTVGRSRGWGRDIAVAVIVLVVAGALDDEDGGLSGMGRGLQLRGALREVIETVGRHGDKVGEVADVGRAEHRAEGYDVGGGDSKVLRETVSAC